ncbi:hypothetical protein CJF31_00003446 [Rutstroemia sp. NJR-2017a BVV2]|nr:hypothetical protein CJF31_00003446 [Rutstroemia sp. NJR-2017a BVV2]
MVYLPVELVSNVLLQAVIARGIKRALRLRLVNKRFYRDVQSALFESRILDQFYTGDVLEEWYTDKNQATALFWHSYLVYRVQHENTLSFPRYLDIRHTAQRVCEETGADLVSTIEIICWPALIRGTNPNNCSRSRAPVKSYLSTPDLNLLCVAAYLNLIPLATRLIEEGVSPAVESTIFDSPMQLAAWAGNAKMLEKLQEHLAEVPDTDPQLQAHYRPPCIGKVHQGAILGAAIRGSMDMVKLAIYPPSRSSPDSLDINGQKCSHVLKRSATGISLSLAKYATRNLDVWKYLQSLFRAEDREMVYDIRTFARHGNLEGMKYLLDSGAGFHGVDQDTRWLNPLVVACHWGHSEIVSLLLERGVDVDYKNNKWVLIYPAICIAARAGNFASVRLLVEHGSKDDFKNGWVEAFAAAVDLEYIAMARYLLDFGRQVGHHSILEIHGGLILKRARATGQDSMVEFLLQEGITSVGTGRDGVTRYFIFEKYER